ncbi:MAG TPA: acyltransferase [Hanamia sp.]
MRKAAPKIDFKILDGLRGIAALYVLFNHARGNLFMGGAKYAQIKDISLWSLKEKLFFSALRLTSLGKEFVILFFILSGFSIAYSLSKGHSKSQFYLRRIIRIYPPYVFALAWAFVVFKYLQCFTPKALAIGSESVFSSFKATVLNFLYVDNGSLIIQFWSLKFEVIFYILIPLFIFRRNYYLVASLIIEIISFFLNWRDVSGSNILSQFILDYNFYFAIGVFCFHHYNIIGSYFIFKNKIRFFLAAIFLFLLMVAFKFWVGDGENKVTFLIAGLFSIIMIFNFLYFKIKNGILMFLGKISYSIYISHFASVMLLLGIFLQTGIINSVDIQNKFLWLTAIPFAIGLSYLFYLIIEKPTKEILNKMRKKDEY